MTARGDFRLWRPSSGEELLSFEHANASFVTPYLAIGGDLQTLGGRGRRSARRARGRWHHPRGRRPGRVERRGLGPGTGADLEYLHLGIDDAGQRVPDEWFDEGVRFALEAVEAGGVVLAHCHMGINRGPSMGFAVLLALGWDAVEALDAIHAARPIAFLAYAEDALRWHHDEGSPELGRTCAGSEVARGQRPAPRGRRAGRSASRRSSPSCAGRAPTIPSRGGAARHRRPRAAHRLLRARRGGEHEDARALLRLAGQQLLVDAAPGAA